MAKYADSIRYPASLTKMMTLYMLFDAVDRGTLKMSSRIRISDRAAKMSPSKLGLKAGSTIRVDDAVRALVTKSANDIAVAIAENLGGSERNFATRMTRRARDLGLTRTVFRNASGLPDMQQVTTARDQAKVAIALLRDFPHYYHYFGVRNFSYAGKTHRNHNRMLGEYRGLDGIKTGFINASGFNLVASAKQNNRRLIGVVMGGQSWRSRNEHMAKLLDEGFATIMSRGPDVQPASIKTRSSTPPIPPPPPFREDADNADARDSNVYATDNEEGDDAQKIDPVIDRVQAMDFEAREKEQVATVPSSAARTVMQLRIPRSQLSSSQIASVQKPQVWSVQVGSFRNRQETDQALRVAQAKLPSNLRNVQPVIVPQSTGSAMIFRARLHGFSETDAHAACAKIGSCVVVSPGS
jgi:D-alanyl-D-alanine carboxypeptidase